MACDQGRASPSVRQQQHKKNTSSVECGTGYYTVRPLPYLALFFFLMIAISIKINARCRHRLVFCRCWCGAASPQHRLIGPLWYAQDGCRRPLQRVPYPTTTRQANLTVSRDSQPTGSRSNSSSGVPGCISTSCGLVTGYRNFPSCSHTPGCVGRVLQTTPM